MKLNELIKKNGNFGFCSIIDKDSSPRQKIKPKKVSKGIQPGEVEMMFADILKTFGDKPFKNKDLSNVALPEKWSLTNRQTPSRLKKLVAAGKLEDLGGSPKSYKVVS